MDTAIRDLGYWLVEGILSKPRHLTEKSIGVEEILYTVQSIGISVSLIYTFNKPIMPGHINDPSVESILVSCPAGYILSVY